MAGVITEPFEGKALMFRIFRKRYHYKVTKQPNGRYVSIKVTRDEPVAAICSGCLTDQIDKGEIVSWPRPTGWKNSADCIEPHIKACRHCMRPLPTKRVTRRRLFLEEPLPSPRILC
jgi:hypothetical protein